MLDPEIPIVTEESFRLGIYIFAFVLILIVVYLVWCRIKKKEVFKNAKNKRTLQKK